jgi:hypothetical protein
MFLLDLRGSNVTNILHLTYSCRKVIKEGSYEHKRLLQFTTVNVFIKLVTGDIVLEEPTL